MKKGILPLFILLIFLSGCDKLANRQVISCIPDIAIDFHPDLLSVEDYRDNVLRKKLVFQSEDSLSCYIIFWKEGEKELITNKTNPTTDHAIILLNLEENSSYSYIILGEDPSGALHRSAIMSFQTSSIPVTHEDYFFNSYSQIHTSTFNGFILTHQREDNMNLLTILNQDGKLVWYQKFHKDPIVFNWTPRGSIVCMLSDSSSLLSECDEIMEINLAGDTLCHILMGEESFRRGLHHDIQVNRAGNIYALDYDYRIIDFSSLGYEDTDTLFCDGIVEVDTNGQRVWEWSAFDVVDPLDDPNSYKLREDWLHANSLVEDTDGNLIVSFRHNDQVWKIDRTSGEVIWKFGRNGDFDLPERDLFSGQHHVHRTNTGDIILFDNNNEASRSRILIFDLDEAGLTARLIKEVILPAHYYTYIMGSVYQTPQQQLLINSTATESIALIDYDGSIVWEIASNGYPYRAVFMENFNNDYAYCTEE